MKNPTAMKSTQPYTATFPFADSPFFEQQKNDTPLDAPLQAQAAEFAQNGYLIFNPNIPAETIDKATESLMPRFFDGDGKGKTARLTQAWRYCQAVQQIAADPHLGKFKFTEVTDVRTGKVIPNTYNGRTLSGFSDWWTRFKNVVRRFKHR